MTTQLEQAQARLTRATDNLATAADHLERYTNVLPERLAGHLRGPVHGLEVHPADEENRVVMHAQHQQAHLGELVRLGAALKDAEAWLAAVEKNEGMATLTGGER